MFTIFKSQKFYSLGGSVLSASFSLVSFSILARALSKADFGLWTFFLTIYSLNDLFRNGLVGRPLIKMGSEGKGVFLRSLISSAFRLSTFSTIGVSVIIGLIFIGVWFYNGDEFYLKLPFWFLVCGVISIPNSMATWTNTMNIRFDRVSVVTGAVKFFFMIGSFIVYWQNLGLDWVLVMFSISILLTTIGNLFMGWTGIETIRVHSKRYFKKITHFGRYSVGAMLGGSALSSSDNWIIMSFLGPEALAIYSVPMRIIGLYDIPLRALVQIAFPTLAKIKNNHGLGVFTQEFQKVNGFTFFMLLPLCIIMFVWAEPIVGLIGGVEYVEQAYLLRIFTVYLVITPLDRFAGIGLDIVNRPNLNLRKMIGMLLINVVGDLLAIYLEGGVTYVAITSIFTFGLGTVAGYYFLRRHMILSWRETMRVGIRELLLVTNRIIKR